MTMFKKILIANRGDGGRRPPRRSHNAGCAQRMQAISPRSR
jgi:hypothetical protein